jgi:hypothetical protein
VLRCVEEERSARGGGATLWHRDEEGGMALWCGDQEGCAALRPWEDEGSTVAASIDFGRAMNPLSEDMFALTSVSGYEAHGNYFTFIADFHGPRKLGQLSTARYGPRTLANLCRLPLKPT